MSIRMRFIIFYICMALGAIFAGINIVFDFLNGASNQDLPWAIITASIFFIGGIVFRIVAVKCPFCNSKLKDPNLGPETCPVCGKSALEKPAKNTTEENEAP